MPWFPGAEHYYNEGVPQNIVMALGREYEGYSVPSAHRYEEPYPRSAMWGDAFSDSLLVLPRLQNYATPYQQYYDAIVAQASEQKP